MEISIENFIFFFFYISFQLLFVRTFFILLIKSESLVMTISIHTGSIFQENINIKILLNFLIKISYMQLRNLQINNLIIYWYGVKFYCYNDSNPSCEQELKCHYESGCSITIVRKIKWCIRWRDTFDC